MQVCLLTAANWSCKPIQEMEVTFKDHHLQRLMTEDAGDTGFPISVINATRKKVLFLEAAPDERTLRQWKSLHYEKLKGVREGQRSIRINLQWRIVFELDESSNPPKIVIHEIVDYHG